LSLRSGFSITELLVAAAVSALGILPVLVVLLSSGSSIRQTAPYQQAIFLSEYSLEEARLGAVEDAHFVDRLVAEGYGATRSPLIQPGHPFLDVLEDSVQPIGRMEVGSDLSLQPQAGPLFKQLQPLALKIDTSIVTGAEAGLPETRVVAQFDWRDLRGKSMVHTAATLVMTWSPVKRIETPAVPLPPGDGSKDQTFVQLTAIGEQGVMVVNQVNDELARIRKSGLPTGAYSKVLALTDLATFLEARAAELGGLVQQMRPLVEELATPGAGAYLRKAAIPVEKRKRAAFVARSMIQGFLGCLTSAMSVNREIACEPNMPASMYLNAHTRLLRIAKLDSFVRPWQDRSALLAYLRSLEEAYRGRMPNVAHYFSAEAKSLPMLDTSYPLIRLVQDVRAFRQNLTTALLNIRRIESVGHDGGAGGL